jgi:hypothetical protein
MGSYYPDTMFESIARKPRSWLLYAQALKKAADLVRNQFDEEDKDHTASAHLAGIHMFLAGLAIENLLKGTLILKHPEKVAKGGARSVAGSQSESNCRERR